MNEKYSSAQNNYTTSGVKEPKQSTQNSFFIPIHVILKSNWKETF